MSGLKADALAVPEQDAVDRKERWVRRVQNDMNNRFVSSWHKFPQMTQEEIEAWAQNVAEHA